MMLENIPCAEGAVGSLGHLLQPPRSRTQPQAGAWDAPVGSAVLAGSVLTWQDVAAAVLGLSLCSLHKNRAWGAATRAP